MGRKKYKPKHIENFVNIMVEQGCMVPGCGAPAEFHHWREGNEPRDDRYGFPLCDYHHRHGPFGEAIHNGLAHFEMAYGTQRQMYANALEFVLRRLK